MELKRGIKASASDIDKTANIKPAEINLFRTILIPIPEGLKFLNKGLKKENISSEDNEKDLLI